MAKTIKLSKEEKERFRSKIKCGELDECWEWNGYCRKEGYGEFRLSQNGYVLAHRVAYVLAYGPIPNNLCVLHQCDNPPCCNPTHLELGTREKNNQDAFTRNRQTRAKGRASHKSKLTEKEVKEIILHYQKGIHGCGTPALATKYGVDAKTVWHIVNGNTWSCITNILKKQ